MTKSEFVDQVADRAGLSKKDAGDAVDAVLETIEDALKRGSDVVFSGFGKFSVSERSAREGRNPATGEKIQIAASRVPKFTAGAAEEGGQLAATLRRTRPRSARARARLTRYRRRRWRASATGLPVGSPTRRRRSCSGSIPIRLGCGRGRSSSRGPHVRSRRRREPRRAVAAHCALVIEAAAEHCVAVKPQVACFERLGAPGWAALARGRRATRTSAG